MKLTNTPSIKRKSGMTLLELTVVILVLLSLIAILFVGARAWKKGSDRSANIMNIRNVQQAMRGHQNMRGLAEGATLASTEIIPSYIKAPTPPTAGIGYAYLGAIPAPGTLYLDVTYGLTATEADYGPTAGSYGDW